MSFACHGYGFSEYSQIMIKKDIENIWLAKELRVQFRTGGKIMEPHKVRQILIKTPEQPVEIVPNKSVRPAIFEDVKRLYRRITEEPGVNDTDDPYEFSKLLIRKIKLWKVALESCETVALKFFSAYEKEIHDGMHLINAISTKLDSFSLITAFYNHREAIFKLSDEIREISTFYLDHTDFWEDLDQSFEAINGHLTGLFQHPDILANCKILKKICNYSAKK
ncbi:MAG: hypothetical protein DSY90_14090 [Deltaproteobacteria bacterium]|nr:MAG: hypothetical protein DSY90_14090 [Deltaproteobacteria bacterium]